MRGRRPARDRHRRQPRRRACCTARSPCCGTCRCRRPLAALDAVSAPRIAAPPARPLGQPRPHRRARLRRAVALGWDALPGSRRTRGTATTRAPTPRIGINGTVLTNVNANAAVLTRRVSREGGGARRRVPALRHPRLSHRALQRADRDRRPDDGRPARSRRARVVEGARPTRSTASIPDFGGFLVKANSEGQPGPAGLPAHARRRRQHARRRGRRRTAAS